MSRGSPDTSRWIAALDRIEADTEAVEAALASEDPESVRPWAPPVDLGPLPVSLRERARALVARSVELQERTRARLSETSDGLGDLDRRRRAGVAYAGAEHPDR